jgi:hypothetical protein
VGHVRTSARRCLAVVPLAAAVLSGCSDVRGPDAEQAAADFAGAADPTARCDLLAPATFASLVQDEGSCAEAIEQLPVGSGEVLAVEVWGEEAQARLADDTLFLTRAEGGWRVSAAACTPAGERRYDCQVEGS